MYITGDVHLDFIFSLVLLFFSGMACYGTCYLLVYTQKRRLRIDGRMDDLINCGYPFSLFLWACFWSRHTRCSRGYSHLYLINWHLWHTLILVILAYRIDSYHLGHLRLNSVWRTWRESHRREQRILHNAAAFVYIVYPCAFVCTTYHLGWHLSFFTCFVPVYLEYLRWSNWSVHIPSA